MIHFKLFEEFKKELYSEDIQENKEIDETPEEKKKRLKDKRLDKKWEKERISYEKERDIIKNISEKEFDIYARNSWNKYESKVKNSEDSIPYWEFKSELIDRYGRKQNENSGNDYLKLQRGQVGVVDDPWSFNFGNGQHGEGVYAFLYGDKPMKDYYTKRGENLYTFKIPKKYVVDLSNKHWDFWEAKSYIYNNPQYKAFIFKHVGIGIPSSREVLITDPNIIFDIL